MATRIFVMLGMSLFCLASPGSSETPFKSAPAKQARDDFKQSIDRLEEKYAKVFEAAKADYKTELDAARKSALEKNDLEEAKRIAEAIKDLESVISSKEVAAVRNRLANSVWEWDGIENKITLHANGSVSATWMKGEKGYWHVNPDLTVIWWSTGHSPAAIMAFNKDYTSHKSYVPKADLARSGRRIE